MSMKDILAKIAKGEELTDAEKAEVQSFDLDQFVGDAVSSKEKRTRTGRTTGKAD